MSEEILIPLSDSQWSEIQAVEKQHQQLEEKKSIAVRFMALGHVAAEVIDAAMQKGLLEVRHLESGAHVLVIPSSVDEEAPHADSTG